MPNGIVVGKLLFQTFILFEDGLISGFHYSLLLLFKIKNEKNDIRLKTIYIYIFSRYNEDIIARVTIPLIFLV